MKVKICGLRRLEDAEAAVEAGADFLGFVFAPSRRRLEAETARQIIGRLRPISAQVVGVFVNASVQAINDLTRYCDLDYVQLSGHEPDEVISALHFPTIKAIHVSSEDPQEELARRIAACPADLLLLDTARPDAYGGTGESFPWESLPPLDRPVLLAGGLRAGNVAEAVAAVAPWGVDVSSGVETGGQKDRAKIREFVSVAKSLS